MTKPQTKATLQYANYSPISKTERQEKAHSKKFINNRKEKYYTNTYMVLDDKFNRVVSANIYCTPLGRVSCCLWVHGSDWVHASIGYRSGSGSASANSGGYHKASAAMADAINDAGISLTLDISGVGDSAMEEALLAIAHEAQRDSNKQLKLIRTNG